MTNSREPRSTFRFAGVSMVLAKVKLGVGIRLAIAETVLALEQTSSRRVSPSSLYRWLAAHRRGGWEQLKDRPQERSATALTPEFLKFLASTKRADPRASIPEVIRRARAEQIIGLEEAIDRTTVYRHARKMNLPLFQPRKAQSTKRPYAYPHRMQMVLCDAVHFRAGANKLKRIAYIYIDDASRHILGVIVGTSENSNLFLKGLYQVIAMHGLMDALYLDKGPGFIAKKAARVSEKLGIPFIFGATRYPQGHGKIERFNRTCRAQCLRGLGKPGIDPNLTSLQLRLQHFVGNEYGKAIHDSLKETPEARFLRDERPLKFPANLEKLTSQFTLEYRRKVREDNVIPFNDTLYEVPLGYAGTRIRVFHNIIHEKISVFHGGKLIELASPDLAFNARERRLKTQNHHEGSYPDITTAAEMNFRNHVKPIVDVDGGYIEPN